MSDSEYVKPKRWEGKPFYFRFKYLIANYPELAFTSGVFFVFVPLVCVYKYMTYEGSRLHSMERFKAKYLVYRDDDPKVEKLEKEKQIGREHFPKY